jgi:hypothetical protein
MIVGAYAVGVHGRPRATKDLDVWVEASSSNAPRVMAALREFGAPLMGLTEADLEQPGMGLQIGVRTVEPNRARRAPQLILQRLVALLDARHEGRQSTNQYYGDCWNGVVRRNRTIEER